MNETMVLIPHDQEGEPDVYPYAYIFDFPKSEFEDRLRTAVGTWLADRRGAEWLEQNGQTDVDWTDALMYIPDVFLAERGIVRRREFEVTILSAWDRIAPLALAS